jgi:uncharacterized membrane protein
MPLISTGLARLGSSRVSSRIIGDRIAHDLREGLRLAPLETESQFKGAEMESRAKLLGHPIHPMLVVFPLGLFVVAVVFDLLLVGTDNSTLALVSFWNIAAGIVGGLLAAVFGAIDWLAIPAGTRAKRIGLLHGVGNVIVVGLFALSWWMRWTSVDYVPSSAAIAVGILGVMLAAVTGWLGGELVDRLGVGVDDDAHLDAPNSLLSGGKSPLGARRTA